MSKLDTDLIRHALETARNHGLLQVRVVHNDDEFEAVLADSSPDEAWADEAYTDEGDTGPKGPVEVLVKASTVGYFRGLDSGPKVGDTVEKGKPVGAIAALGLQNEVVASASGEWIEWLVEADQAVEYGQPIGRIKESA